ncbi:2Fe-2S iron-sulfur cluster-binding protein [Candidatus Palauibacter soopunensis]|uniref:2Fe-2S iron-sulfur cluster-binding protein n=1 Tax=Candidatus Palauibacter soopunensis TaxID=3056739 RepID=UPI00238EC9B8|nr:2Fe-2S iron-sulfur cluster-binding protein [Candidatus Palauibacter soopunensis]MDE2877640.1 FAD-dependent oxidoreductase [Candidatus Palauibacter soopunensis]
MSRLPPSSTERLDRSRPLDFRWCGRALEGFEGDTVASALWGAGIRTFGRSFEYHRPRGLYDLEGEGSSQLVSIDGVPNQSAGTAPLREGMEVGAQNVRGDPRFDAFGFLDRLDRFMPAGFYYRLFHRPAWAARFFQERMRALAGLGVLRLDAAERADAGERAERYLHADVAVVGGGPAGLSAALEAGRRGLRVCLFERRPWLGGHLDWRVRDGRPLADDVSALVTQVEGTDSIRVVRHAPVTGIWGENLLTGFQHGGAERAAGGATAGGSATMPFDRGPREVHWECRARTIVVATGSIERPLVFEHNDRPGVMQVDTAIRLARTYGVRPGAAAAFSVGDDLGLEAAADLAALGVDIRVVADARREGHDPELVDALSAAGIDFRPGWAATRVRGRGRVRGVEVAARAGSGAGGGGAGDALRVACDLLVASAGRQPDIGVLSCAGARFRHGERTRTFELERLPPDVFAAGGVLRLTDLEALTGSGRIAGLEAAAACGTDVAGALTRERARLADLPGPARGSSIVRGPAAGRRLAPGRKAFLDFDEDGTWKNAAQCAAYAFDVPELAKRFGNFGLGPGQYRVPGQNLAMAMAEIAGRPVGSFAATTVRPPVIPPSLATLAGPNHDIHKRTPLHDDQASRGAVFRRAGPWQRARYFSEDRECLEEIRNVRENVGLLDSSPLGKFRIWGPDALRALQRAYVSDMTRARPGRCAYSAMCNDTGNIIDDGVVVRTGEDEFYFTTSSNRAGTTVEWLRFHTRYDGWDYNLVNLTDALASINVAGPNARRVLEKITGADLSDEAFPYLGCREIEVGDGVAARCLRLGFVGELSYELHVRASCARYVWDLLWEAGAEYGIRPFGLEAQNCLRAEKGHVIIGTESEQRVTLLDIGMGWLWDREDLASGKVGAAALRHCEEQAGRLKLVGLRIDDGDIAHRPEDGALVVDGERIAGFVCTTRHSATLGWQYGLALVEDRLAERGRSLDLYESPGRRTVRSTATVVPPHFYDPKGQRLRIAPEGRPRRSGEASSQPAPAAHRRSPVRFDAAPARTERRAGWNVVLDYETDRASTDALRQACLIDLSHRTRWDAQHRNIRAVQPFGLDVPRTPGDVQVRDGLMINRMNGTQASIWHVGPGAPPAMPDSPHYTDTTDSHCWLALLGDSVQEVLESVTDLDLLNPVRARPFLTQGPVLHVPCQVVTWRDDAVLIAFSRGYAQAFVEALLESGRHAGLRPAGERVFTDWIHALES